jgi:hypothetical protein
VRCDPAPETDPASTDVGASKRSSTAGVGREIDLRVASPGGYRLNLKVECCKYHVLNHEEGWRNPYPAESVADLNL